jgi:N-acetylneuraminic acid mutarotase
MPTARNNLAAAILDGKIYAIGGYGATYLKTVEEYFP